MAGFDLEELMPYYLDETDEQIAGLNDALLRLEREPSDGEVLREAFRMIHSIKGSSTVMGFDQVKHLTHHLETFFDQLRGGQRQLDRPTLDLSFRCLDGLRDYHRELRSGKQDAVDLSSLTEEVLGSLNKASAPVSAASSPAPEVVRVEPGPTTVEPSFGGGQGGLRLTVVFAPDLPWPDMKAKLVLNRLSSKARVLDTDPPVDQLEAVEKLTRFTLRLIAECGDDELRGLADVEGVTEILIEPAEPQREPADAPQEVAVIESAPTPVAESIAHGPDPAAKVPTPEVAKPAAVAKKVAETLRVDVDRLDHMMNLAGELVINRARFFQIADGLEDLFRDSSARLLTSDTEDRLDSLTRDLETFAEGGTRSVGPVDRWLSQCRRLRENFQAIRDQLDLILKGRERVNALTEAIHQLALVTDGIQKSVLETRMVPIGPLFERFHRVIRDLRVSSDKEVALRIEGEHTELDKRMIDELSDPLIHLVRNSVDHGIESPESRAAAGKPREGSISLQASHRGNSVMITVSDDGRGIDVERIRGKIVAKGLVSEEEARRLNERQLVAYIWHPGFSTAEQVTDISGRGVGMDIVKSRIENLNGTLEVRSEPGKGTTFTIRLPLTLAILPCLLVEIFDEVYAIPLDHIDEIVEVETAGIFKVRGRRMIETRNRLVSLVALDDVLSWGVPSHKKAAVAVGDDSRGKATVVIARNGEETIGLMVDRLMGMQEVVLKSLEKNFHSIPSLSGASILGDGRVSLILDIDALIGMVSLDKVQPVG
jgi:two-component system chemotaxis sensor kinase CheA